MVIPMVALFKKEREVRSISAEDKGKLAEAAKNLGYDVGYHRHSEIGWVQESLSRLDEFAAQYDLKDFAREQYRLGKEEGSITKDRDTKGGFIKEYNKDEEERYSIGPASGPETNISASKVNSRYRNISYEFENSSAPIQKPSMFLMPGSVEFPSAVKRPSILEGSRHLLPKK